MVSARPMNQRAEKFSGLCLRFASWVLADPIVTADLRRTETDHSHDPQNAPDLTTGGLVDPGLLHRNRSVRRPEPNDHTLIHPRRHAQRRRGKIPVTGQRSSCLRKESEVPHNRTSKGYRNMLKTQIRRASSFPSRNRSRSKLQAYVTPAFASDRRSAFHETACLFFSFFFFLRRKNAVPS